jgi:hypothetical protein
LPIVLNHLKPSKVERQKVCKVAAIFTSMHIVKIVLTLLPQGPADSAVNSKVSTAEADVLSRIEKNVWIKSIIQI